jgi:Rho GTPase-activating protein 1
MKQAFSRRARNRAHSLSTVPPPLASEDYSPALAKAATSILYRSPIPSKSGHTIYILNVAALPDTHEVDYDSLLPYVLSRLPGEEDLIKGVKYEIVLFAGAGPESATGGKKNQPGWGWFVQAYHVLSRAMRKRIQRLYIVHEKTWVRVLAEMFSTVVSHKFRRKVVHGESIFVETWSKCSAD